MKPKRIYLLRHGEAEGNVDERLFESKPDHRMQLTERGRQQSVALGQDLRQRLIGEKLRIYVSPYVRTYQTLHALGIEDLVEQVLEEPRLREQDWGNYQDGQKVRLQKEERNRFGHFFYRLAHGESGADVYDRVSTFLESLHRHFEDPRFPDNVMLVTHGLTMRLFLTRYFRWSVAYFESLENPGFCELIELRRDDQLYVLDQPLRQWKNADRHSEPSDEPD